MTRRDKYLKLRKAGFSSYDATKYKDHANIDSIIDNYLLKVGDTVILNKFNSEVVGKVTAVDIPSNKYTVNFFIVDKNFTVDFMRDALTKYEK